jgi:hypothetical protein
LFTPSAVKKGILVNKHDLKGVTNRHSNADFDAFKADLL